MKLNSGLLLHSSRAVMILVVLLALYGRAIESPREKQWSGTISVSVVGISGGAYPLAQLLLVNLDTLHTIEQEYVPDGKFSFTQLLPAQYLVIAGHPNSCLVPAMKTASILAGKTVEVKLQLVLNRENPNCLKSIE